MLGCLGLKAILAIVKLLFVTIGFQMQLRKFVEALATLLDPPN